MDYFNNQGIFNPREENFIHYTRIVGKLIPIIVENELTTQQKRVFNLHFREYKTQIQISDALGISQPTVSRHLNASIENVNSVLQYVIPAISIFIIHLSHNDI